MFILEMAIDNAITEKKFSWYMSGLSGSTYIDFGAPNTAVYDASNLIKMSIKSDNYHWTNTITGIRWKTNSNDKTEYKFTEKNALTDTGSSCIIGPASEVNYFKNTILNMIPNVETHSSWSYQFDCSDSSATALPSFELLFGGYWFEVLPEDYII